MNLYLNFFNNNGWLIRFYPLISKIEISFVIDFTNPLKSYIIMRNLGEFSKLNKI